MGVQVKGFFISMGYDKGTPYPQCYSLVMDVLGHMISNASEEELL
jgi:hypothetical protein